jgi:hypothetical protein
MRHSMERIESGAKGWRETAMSMRSRLPLRAWTMSALWAVLCQPSDFGSDHQGSVPEATQKMASQMRRRSPGGRPRPVGR